MKRSEFLKIFGLGSSGLIIPKLTLVQQPIKIYENYIKGMQHYSFPKIKHKINIGDGIELLRENNNKYDSFAIGAYFDGQKLGYLPAYENVVIANLLEQGVQLYAFVTQINPSDFYNGVAIEILAELVIENKKGLIPELLTKPADEANDIYRKGF